MAEPVEEMAEDWLDKPVEGIAERSRSVAARMNYLAAVVVIAVAVAARPVAN